MKLQFLNPEWFWLLPLTLIPFFLHRIFSKPSQYVLFSDLKILKILAPRILRRERIRQSLLNLIRGLILLFLIFFLTRPILPVSSSFYKKLNRSRFWNIGALQQDSKEKRTYKILILEDRPELSALPGESFYLREALKAQPTPFEITTVSLEDLNEISFNSFDAIALIDPSTLTTQAAMDLVHFLDSGKSLFISLGNKFSGSLNEILKNKLPIDSIRSIPAQSLVLKPSSEYLDYDWHKIEVFNHYEVSLRKKALPELLLENQSPLLVLSEDNRSALWLSSIDTTWTNLPTKPLYTPMMRTLFYNLCTPASKRIDLTKIFLYGLSFLLFLEVLLIKRSRKQYESEDTCS